MTYQHREFQSRLRDAERLRLYAQSVVSDHRALSASLVESESSSRRWENEAKESIEKVAQAKAERDVAHREASMARMDVDAVGSARMKVESKLARVQNALAISGEARRKAEYEARHMAVKRVSLLLELGTSKDEVSALQAQTLKEKKALKEASEEGFDVIFNYGYGCCAFVHNICGNQLVVPNEMSDTSKPLSPEFFINRRCPSGSIPTEATAIDVHLGEAMNALEREAPATVLETDISKASKHLFVAEVGPSNEPDFSA